MEVVDLGLDFGVLGLRGTEANLDWGRGLKPSSLSEEKSFIVFLRSGGGRILMTEAKDLSGPMILEYPAPRLRRSAG